MSPELTTFLSSVRDKTNAELDSILSNEKSALQSRLSDAMRYAVLNGGKRVRPVLCFASAAAASSESEALNSSEVLASACSLELIHSYSLVHDDLPAMDDDDLRRGQPTTHIKFDEATAVLAGDALQTAAFETLSQAEFASTENQVVCIAVLAKASGAAGMCGGQMIDLNAVGQSVDAEYLEQMHQLKTGALIKASVLIGAKASGNAEDSLLESLETYSHALGLAFQVKDDILDATSDTETLGKPQGSDAQSNKPTYVSLLGVDGAQRKLTELLEQALASLQPLGDTANQLRDLAKYVVERTD